MDSITTPFRVFLACALFAAGGLTACDDATGAGGPEGADHRDPAGEAEEAHAAHAGEAEDAHAGHAEAGEPTEVALAPEAVARAGIEVSEVRRGSLRDHVKVTAMVEHDVNRVAHIAPMVEGQISDIRARLGERVEAGQTLAVMRSVSLGEARAAVNQASADVEVARRNFERQQKLVEKGIASERSFIEAEGALKRAQARQAAARAGLRALDVSGGTGPTYPLKSHIDGTIIEQHASLGETKGPQDELFVVADQSTVWVIGRVPEQKAHAVSEGMPATVTLDAYPGRRWEGTVDWIGSTLDQKTRLLPIRVELENPERRLKPGMFGSIHLTAQDGGTQVPLVPVDAVQSLHGESVVFVPGEHAGEFRVQPVEVGAEAEGFVEIESGLPPDARVVTEGAFDVKAALTAGSRSADHHH